MGYLTYFFIF